MPKFLKLLSLAAGLLWLTLGFYAATSPNIAPKILALNYSYIAAWIIVYELPSALLIWLGLRRRSKPETITERVTKEIVAKPQEKTFYEESCPELSEEEAQLQETQEIEEDMDEEKMNAAQINNIQPSQPKIADKVIVQQVYTIGEPELELETQEEPEDDTEAVTMQTYRCRMCDKQISVSDYLRYNGMCYLCWMKERRRSGLLGADRASTW